MKNHVVRRKYKLFLYARARVEGLWGNVRRPEHKFECKRVIVLRRSRFIVSSSLFGQLRKSLLNGSLGNIFAVVRGAEVCVFD